MIDLYTWSTPNGRKISIALEEFQLPFRVIEIDINNGDQHTPEFIALSPNQKIPAIVDHDSGVQMAESGAILMYLADKTGKFLDRDRYYETLQWLMWQMAHLGPILGQGHHFLKYNSGVSEYAEQRFHKEANRLYGVLNNQLADHEYIVSEYSIVDMACWPWVSRFEWHQVNLHEYPNVKRWFLEIAKRPAVIAGYDVPKRDLEIPMP
ncbi:MAG: GST-like protein [Parasphingorhabdus sp.]|jgi:GST-like protein